MIHLWPTHDSPYARSAFTTTTRKHPKSYMCNITKYRTAMMCLMQTRSGAKSFWSAKLTSVYKMRMNEP